MELIVGNNITLTIQTKNAGDIKYWFKESGKDGKTMME